jgi:hypothetical protein
MSTGQITKIKPKRERLLQFYIGPSKANATDAARRAGYKHPDKLGPRILADPLVRRRLAELTDDVAVSMTEIHVFIRQALEVRVSDFYDADGNLTRASIKASGKDHLVRDLVQTRNGISIKIIDPRSLIEIVCKCHGALRERVDLRLTYPISEYNDPRQLEQIENGEDPGPPLPRAPKALDAPQSNGNGHGVIGAVDPWTNGQHQPEDGRE